jgi:hypothetical protein
MDLKMTNDPVTVDLESTLDSIMRRIGEMSHPDCFDDVRNDAKEFIEEGWLPSEIVDHLRCREEVDKELEEDVALARMAVIEKRVEARLRAERNQH